MPRRGSQNTAGLRPWRGLGLRTYWAKDRTEGIAQNVKGTFTAGHSHRLTSGGKAEAASRAFRETHLPWLSFRVVW